MRVDKRWKGDEGRQKVEGGQQGVLSGVLKRWTDKKVYLL